MNKDLKEAKLNLQLPILHIFPMAVRNANQSAAACAVSNITK